MSRDAREHKPTEHDAILSLLGNAAYWVHHDIEHIDELSSDERTTLIFLDLALAVARGLIFDGVILNGFDSINELEYSDWLSQNRASTVAINSAQVRVFYDLAFAFKDG